ncbi:uncharacterized protein EHS24_007666 [Apiotrichum porosum]|uniref:RRM domain-containing protein n=1 Tax=Apiotrichum porosum TaxID=105984 RepID=A0A427XV10_9TREE|nr:uncharacterized protein EHS24_007666 [Apiotrichum porosum]RSH82672.1 hypothetical protein EHS24_007666 [Apiotrichum porosum]
MPSTYVGRLPQGVTKADLEDHFKTIGRVVDIRLMANFGFVEFETAEDVEAACRELDGKTLMGERLIVEPSKEVRKRDFYDGARPPPRGPPRGRGIRINVIGISNTTSWQDLKDFGRNGNESVTYADVDRFTGHGVIEYPTMVDAEDAIRRLEGVEIQGVPVKLEIVQDAGGGGRDSYDRPPPRDYGRDRGYGRERYDDRGPRFDDRPPRFDDRPPRFDDRPPRFDDRGGRFDRRGDDRRGDDRRDRYDERDRYEERRYREEPPRDSRDRYENRAPREDRPPRQDERVPHQDERAPHQEERVPRQEERSYSRERSPPRRD